jgi:hypothetical protein
MAVSKKSSACVNVYMGEKLMIGRSNSWQDNLIAHYFPQCLFR